MSEAAGLIADRARPGGEPRVRCPSDAMRSPAGAVPARLPRRWLATRVVRAAAAAIIAPLAHRGAVAVVDQAIVSATSFATSMFIGRLCTKEEFGIYFIALSVVFFVRGVQDNIISAPYMIYCHRRRDAELAIYSGSSLAHHVALSLATLAGLTALACVLWAGMGPATLIPVILVLLGAAPLMLLREFVRQFSFAHLHVWTAVILDAAVAALQLGTLLLLGCFHRLSPVTIYATMGGACAIAAAGWFLSTRHPMQLTRARALADWWHNWAFGKWALAGQLIGSAATYLLPWILVSACGEAETGMLAACATLIGVANMFVTGMGNFLVPRTAGAFAAGGVGALGRVLGKAGALYTAFFALFGVLVLAAGEQLTVLIYGAKYSGVGPILGLLALAMFADALGRVAGNGLWAMERPSANFLADVCSLFVLIVSAVCLIRPLGVIGVAIVQLSATLTGTAVRGVTLLRLAQSLRIEAAGGNA